MKKFITLYALAALLVSSAFAQTTRSWNFSITANAGPNRTSCTGGPCNGLVGGVASSTGTTGAPVYSWEYRIGTGVWQALLFTSATWNASAYTTTTYRQCVSYPSTSCDKVCDEAIYTVNCTCCRVSGDDPNVDNIQDGQINVYPVPSSGVLTVESPGSDKNYLIQIYDSKGESVYSSEYKGSSSSTINLSDRSRGIYYIQLFDNSGEVYFKRIVLQ